MFPALFLISSAVSAGGSLMAAQGQAKSAALNAENIETQRIMNNAAALQKANDRYEQFKIAESTNRALLMGAMGRDVTDRSVSAFLERNRQTAFSDMDRIETQRQMEDMRYTMEAASERRRAADIQASGVVNAFSSILSSMVSYQNIMMPGAGGASAGSLAPTTSPFPRVRPF